MSAFRASSPGAPELGITSTHVPSGKVAPCCKTIMPFCTTPLSVIMVPFHAFTHSTISEQTASVIFARRLFSTPLNHFLRLFLRGPHQLLLLRSLLIQFQQPGENNVAEVVGPA